MKNVLTAGFSLSSSLRKRGMARLVLIVTSTLFLVACAGPSIQRAPEGNRLLDRPAPEFSVQTLQDNTFRLKDSVGDRLIVLNVFGTWCPPCRAELPALNELYHRNKESVLLFGIALNAEETNVRRFMENLNLDFPVTMTSRNLEQGMTDRYEIPTVPTTIVIGRSGHVLYYKPGMLRKPHFDHLLNLIKEFQRTDSN